MGFAERVREVNLLQLGLYKKIYAPDNKKSEEYSFEEKDKDGTVRYYKKEIFKLTNEEYDKLIACELTPEDFLDPVANKKLKFKEKLEKSTYLEIKVTQDRLDDFINKLKALTETIDEGIQADALEAIKKYTEIREYVHKVFIRKVKEAAY